MTNTDELRDLFAEVVGEYNIVQRAHIYEHSQDIDGDLRQLEDECRDYDRRLDALLEETTQGSGEKTQGWRSVDEALPEVNDDGLREVLLTDGERVVSGRFYNGIDRFLPDNQKYMSPGDVAYWRLPPAPPSLDADEHED